MTTRVYLDHNATMPLAPAARTAMLSAMDEVGNPSSVHGEGRSARRVLERARQQVAELVGARPQHVIFTSGATEAARLAWHLLGQGSGSKFEQAPGNDVYADWAPQTISAIEHDAVKANVTPGPLTSVQPRSDGQVDPRSFAAAALEQAKTGGTAVAALMLANNETGCIQPVGEVARLLASRDADSASVSLICDAVQAPGRIPIDVTALGCDALILSAHKFGGPKGVGALIIDVDGLTPATGVIRGDQERRHRGGTENLIGIAGMGAAAHEARLACANGAPERLRALRDQLEHGLTAAAPDAQIISAAGERLPNTTCVIAPGIQAEIALARFDLEGIALSSGAACSSGKVSSSHVLAAMGVAPDLRGSALRFSVGPTSTPADIERALEAWQRLTAGRAGQRAA